MNELKWKVHDRDVAVEQAQETKLLDTRVISKMDKGFFVIGQHFVARHPASSIKYHNTISPHNYHQHNIFNVPKNNVLWVKVENYTVKALQ